MENRPKSVTNQCNADSIIMDGKGARRIGQQRSLHLHTDTGRQISEVVTADGVDINYWDTKGALIESRQCIFKTANSQCTQSAVPRTFAGTS